MNIKPKQNTNQNYIIIKTEQNQSQNVENQPDENPDSKIKIKAKNQDLMKIHNPNEKSKYGADPNSKATNDFNISILKSKPKPKIKIKPKELVSRKRPSIPKQPEST